MEALLRAKGNTSELHTNKGINTALSRRRATRPSPSSSGSSTHHASHLWPRRRLVCCGAARLWPAVWVLLSMVFGAIATLAFSRTLTAGADTELLENIGTALRGTLKPTAEPTRQHVAPPQPAAVVPPHAMQEVAII